MSRDQLRSGDTLPCVYSVNQIVYARGKVDDSIFGLLCKGQILWRGFLWGKHFPVLDLITCRISQVVRSFQDLHKLFAFFFLPSIRYIGLQSTSKSARLFDVRVM